MKKRIIQKSSALFLLTAVLLVCSFLLNDVAYAEMSWMSNEFVEISASESNNITKIIHAVVELVSYSL